MFTVGYLNLIVLRLGILYFNIIFSIQKPNAEWQTKTWNFPKILRCKRFTNALDRIIDTILFFCISCRVLGRGVGGGCIISLMPVCAIFSDLWKMWPQVEHGSIVTPLYQDDTSAGWITHFLPIIIIILYMIK